MDNTIIYSAILQSWQNCIKESVPEDITGYQKRTPKEVLDKIITLNSTVIKEYNNLIDAHISIIRNIKGIHNFMLLDDNLNVISCKRSPYNIKNINKHLFVDGTSYSEKNLGTNAAQIAKILKIPVYMHPQYNYCNILKNWYMYCVPIRYKVKSIYYICVASYKFPIIKPMEGFLDLIATNMSNQQSSAYNWDKHNSHNKDYLTAKQKEVLKKIAEGLSNEQISAELNMSLSTVKYHSQNIFDYLGVTSRVDAVIKGIMSNELNLYDICNSR